MWADKHFTTSLKKQLKDPILDSVDFKSWEKAFAYITDRIITGKNNNVLLILCGSVASFMIKKVLSSNALYGRVTLEILLKGLPANEAALMFKNKRSKEEILKYLLVSPYFAKSDRKFQIDLLHLRADKVVTVCEIKHLKEPVFKGIIPEMARRCSLLEIPRGYSMEKALVSLYGPDDALRESGYFNHYITLEDILG